MANYQEQLQRVVDALRARQRKEPGPHMGGWGDLLEPRAPASIVNTAEAVSVFALAGARLDDDALCDGLRYLREKVTLHPRPNGNEARGAKARYAAFGLMGLTAFAELIGDDEHADAIAACVRWLDSHTLDDGQDTSYLGRGWSEHPRRQTVSMLSTSVAAQALSRVPAGAPEAELARELAEEARRRIHSLARGNEYQRWWPVRADADPALGDEVAGAATTALAVLALADGDPRSQSYARSGIRWLMANTGRWAHQREIEENVIDTNWTHASNPLCLRAILCACGGIDPQSPQLEDAISYLDQLWSQRAGEWRHGHVSADVSTSADVHAASAIRAMRRSWRGFDPAEHILANERRRTRPSSPAGDKPHEIRWFDGTLIVRSSSGETLMQHAFPARAIKMRALLDALTGKWAQAGIEATYVDRSLSTAEIRTITGISAVSEYVKRLNVAAGEASRRERGRSCVIVRRIESGSGASQDSYALLGKLLALEP